MSLDYDKYIVGFSGGKDSTACFLHLLDSGVPKEKIELWHHKIDGEDETFMDWEITEDYCRKFAEAFGVPIYFSWRDGGFLKEMLRNGSQATGDVFYEGPDGIHRLKSRKTFTVRRKFPQTGAIESGRYCSALLKIDVCTRVFNNDLRFKGKRIAFITGERGEESPNRAKLSLVEKHKSHTSQRHIDQIRLIRDWSEQKVWAIIEKYKVRVHPCYYLGWGRCSCKFCIFGNSNQMASARHISPVKADIIAEFENEFGHTIKHIGNKNIDLLSFIEKGSPYDAITEFWTDIALSSEYNLNIFCDTWILPAGAYGESCGPS